MYSLGATIRTCDHSNFPCPFQPNIPSGEEMVEESGVPVHEDWSIAPEEDKVKFSLSGVTPHSWKENEHIGLRGKQVPRGPVMVAFPCTALSWAGSELEALEREVLRFWTIK